VFFLKLISHYSSASILTPIRTFTFNPVTIFTVLVILAIAASPPTVPLIKISIITYSLQIYLSALIPVTPIGIGCLRIERSGRRLTRNILSAKPAVQPVSR